MNLHYRFIQPLDVLFLRGNKLFGDPGSYGEALIPPWPSVAAGAIRSRMLVDKNIDLKAFAAGKVSDDAELGTPEQPGSFTLMGFYLARKTADGQVTLLLPPPADLVVSKTADDALWIDRLSPKSMALASSFPLPMLPVLAQGNKRSKPEAGYWLTQAGWLAYLNGQTPLPEQLEKSSLLWSLDARVGIGMNSATRSVEEGKLFTTQAVAMNQGVGFLAAVSGAIPPESGLLRLGGDGRAANIQQVDFNLPEADYAAMAHAKRCRIVLTSPGLFPDGWKLPGCESDHRVRLPGGIQARLVSAAIPRAETISGWDLAKWQPKPAQKAVPTGSVYWLDELDATESSLRKLAENGLWGEPCEHVSRRAEGFNRMALAAW
ncbi:MAG: type III-B CRISPR module-associated protein Cmr3 [Methylococcales bacterium]|nr:type III-B CRISPR module-associated protein Cmr3 [Methylococcales bacterium]